MSLSTAFSKILTGYTVNTTDAPAVNINWQQTNQTSKKEMLDKFCDYADAIYYKSGSTYYLVDAVNGNGNTLIYEDFELINQAGRHSGNIVGRFVAKYTEKEFSRNPTGSPMLSDIPKQISASTGFTGKDKEIDIASYTTALSGSDIVYNNANLASVLTRKVTLHNRKEISISIDGFKTKESLLGTRIEFTSEVSSGWFICTRIKYKLTDLKTEISGLGEITV